MSSATPSLSEALDSIHRSLSEICSLSVDWFENPRKFSALASRLEVLVKRVVQCYSESEELIPLSVQTSLKGISIDLCEAALTVAVYRTKSKIFVLLHCRSLCDSLCQRTTSIASWLSLIESSLLHHDHLSFLTKKLSDLSRDMKLCNFTVTENEERVQLSLEKEGEAREAAASSASASKKAVETAIIMDLCRALGIDSNELAHQLSLFKSDLQSSTFVSDSDRRISLFLDRVLLHNSTSSKSNQPPFNYKFDLLNIDACNWNDRSLISPFDNFLCPLTKQIMSDPVVVDQSSQTYDRPAITYWFHRCIDDGRDPTCPVTGLLLKSLKLTPNIGLAGAIQEWVDRNIDILLKSSVDQLSQEPVHVDSIERALDVVYNISEDHPSTRFRIRNAGVVPLILTLLRNSSKTIGTHFRAKALLALLSMTKDEESKKVMLEEGITRMAIHGLSGSSEKEREYALKLLLEFTSDKAYCIKLASEKGALVLLSSISGNLEHPALSKLAEDVLKRVETVEANIQPLATAGRFEPLLTRLCEGVDDVKIEMASIVGTMTLTNASKEHIARQSAKVLVELLSKPEGRAPSLKALHNLSSLDDNATVLVDSMVFPALTNILFRNQGASTELKELASSTMANIVANPGQWELASVDNEGNSMQSEPIVFSLLGLLSVASPRCQVSVLHILCGIASSPQATDSVAAHIKSCGGIKIIIPFLEHPEVEHRINAFRITRILSARFGQDLLEELKPCDKLPFLKNKLLDDTSTDGERSDAACILANLPLIEDEVKELLGASFVKWAVFVLQNRHHAANGRMSKPVSSMIEGILGLLSQFTKNLDQETLCIVKEHRLMTIFCEQLDLSSRPRVKQLAALGLKNLSEAGWLLAADCSEPPPPNGFCASMVFMCGSGPPKRSTCPIHNVPCDESSQLCLLMSNSIKPLVELLTGKETGVQIAAVETLSTLVRDSKRAVNELEQQGVVQAMIVLFTEVRPGELQEKAIWMIDRMLRVEGCSHNHSLNQALVRALVEAFKHGNANTREHARNALTNLKQLSAVSGKSTSQAHPPR